MKKMRLNINGREVEGFQGQMILDVALENDIQIPTFCYDNRLDIYGSCGICIVEVEGSPKLLRACSTLITDGMVIRTDTKRVNSARKLNLELLLSTHNGDCRAPCSLACPAQTDCQGYVGLIANGEVDEAIKLIKSKVPLAASVSRICPRSCEDACRRKLVEEPISILNLKRYAAKIDLDKPEPFIPKLAPPTGKKVAIIGGGPGGLSCAYFLAEKGHTVRVFDMMPKMGGMLRYGIPEYRLPKTIVDTEAALIEKMGVTFVNNMQVGKDTTFSHLRKTHDAVIIAVGAWTSIPLNVPGSELDGVYGGIDFLRKVVANEPIILGRSVAVIGGGNTAMDACRTAIRLGAQVVYNIYRRTRAEMLAQEVEIVESDEEGIIFKFLTHPLEIIAENGMLTKIRLQKMRLGELDESGRRRPEPIEGDEEVLEVDSVICAIGQGVNSEGFDEIELSRWRTIVADEDMFTTNIPGVFALGDCINDGATIAIDSIADAKKAASAVNNYLNGAQPAYLAPYRVTRHDLSEADFDNFKKEPRSLVEHMDPEVRRDNFFEYTRTFLEESAKKDALRCLECGCSEYFDCKLIEISDRYEVDPERFRESVPKIEFEDEHPFIQRDPNKCILCGLCVRICSEIIGATALGFVERGYNTIVQPAFGDALKDTTCISCGECIQVCPTGALAEKLVFKKPIPFNTKKTDTVCPMCAVGCSVQIETAGNLILKAKPAKNDGVNDGLICGRGRFGLNYIQKEDRITVPMVRLGNELTEVSWDEAFVYTAKKMKSFKMLREKTAVAIGHTYCIEDAGAIKNLADLFGSEIFSFSNRYNGLANVLGFDRSPNTLEEVPSCDKIIVLGETLFEKPAALVKMRRAIKNGANVTVISKSKRDFNLPCNVIQVENTTRFIKETTKALIDLGCAPENAVGYEELAASLKAIKPRKEAKKLANDYKNAKKAMVLFAMYELTTAAMTELGNMAVISGHIGSPRDGIYMLRNMAGSQALADLGITKTREEIDYPNGLIIFGENIDIPTDNLEFLMVQDTHMTEIAAKADAVFPLATYPEIDGVYATTERRLMKCNQAVSAPMQYRTSEIAQKIAEVIETSAPVVLPSELYPKAKLNEPYPSPVLGTEGFGFPDKKAKLQIVKECEMFSIIPPTTAVISEVEATLQKG